MGRGQYINVIDIDGVSNRMNEVDVVDDRRWLRDRSSWELRET